jgi:inosine-uridine nucleoside N-ribohydrolase
LPEALFAERDGAVNVVLDTDTYNEIDDQFALAHLLLAPDRVNLQAIYAAPFENSRSSGPADGMRKSLAEAQRVMSCTGREDIATYEGSTAWLSAGGPPQGSPGALDLISRSQMGVDDLYVVAIGAATNVASALLLDPSLCERVTVVWLGGNTSAWPTAREFNLEQDPLAARVLLASGVPLIRVPCLNIADHLVTTRAELSSELATAGDLGALLLELFDSYVPRGRGISKVIWDMAATAVVLSHEWTTVQLVRTPVLTEELTWSGDASMPLSGEVTSVARDKIFGDFFERLARGSMPWDGLAHPFED